MQKSGRGGRKENEYQYIRDHMSLIYPRFLCVVTVAVLLYLAYELFYDCECADVAADDGATCLCWVDECAAPRDRSSLHHATHRYRLLAAMGLIFALFALVTRVRLH